MAETTRLALEHTDDIVVALSHSDLVLDELGRLVEMELLAAPPHMRHHSDRLGLGMIELKFRPDPVVTSAEGVAAVSSFGVTEALAMVRESCRYKYRGWMPTMGKNRVVSGIAGEGGYLAGGGGYLAGGGGYLAGGGGYLAGGGGYLAGGGGYLAGGGGYLAGGGGYLAGGGGGLPELADHAPRRPRGDRGHDAKIAILDGPIYRGTAVAGHVDYVGKQPAKREPMPMGGGHAVFILGLVQDAAPGARITVRPTLDLHAVATAWEVATAMADCADGEVDVVNLSLGCYTVDNEPPLLLQRAVDLLSARTLVVAAAGNHRQPRHPRPFWPAAMENVIAVGARDEDNRLATFSPRAPWVDVTAPGVHVVSQYLDGKVELAPRTERDPAEIEEFPGYARWRGTSFAAATVTGEIARHMTGKRDPHKALERMLAQPHEATPVRRYHHHA